MGTLTEIFSVLKILEYYNFILTFVGEMVAAWDAL